MNLSKIDKLRPIINDPNDPAGIAHIRARCLREFRKRVKALEPLIKKTIRDTMSNSLVEVVQVNEVVIEPKAHIVNRASYVYEIDATRQSSIDLFIKNMIYRSMLGVDDPLWSANWWMNTYINKSVEKGTMDSLQTAQNLAADVVVGAEISQEVRSLTLEQVIQQPVYRRRIEKVYARTFNAMVGFSDETAKQVSGIMARAIASGVNYRSVAKDVSKVFDDMAGWRALRIVRTEMGKSATDAHMDNAKDLNRDVFDKGGYEVKVMHLSALTETSRIWHMSRSGKIYTMDEQQAWWDEGSNRINCLCSVVDILVDKKTGEPLQTALHKKAVEQRERRIGS